MAIQFIHATTEQEWIYHATSFFSDCLDEYECPLITFPTGNTPAPFYQSLRNNKNIIGRDFRFLMLDEYAGLDADDPRHFSGWITRDLLDPLNVPDLQRHLFDPYATDINAECDRFRRNRNDLGKLHLAFLGVGSNGHVAMNDPPADKNSSTRIIHMDDETYNANEKYWGISDKHLPRTAYTLGINDIFQSQKIVIFLRHKNELLERLKNIRDADENFPVSLLYDHPHITVLSL